MSWGPNCPGKQQGTQRDARTHQQTALDASFQRKSDEVGGEME